MTGHILPDTNDTYDIGSAEYKIRDLYLSNNSLWIGDENKISVNQTTNEIEFKKRKTNEIPQSFLTQGKNNELEIINSVGVASLSNMTLSKWKEVAILLNVSIDGKSGSDIDTNYIFDVNESNDWKSSINTKSLSNQITILENKVGQSLGITDNVVFNDISCANVSVSNDLNVTGNLTVNSAATINNDLTISGRMIIALGDEPPNEELNAKALNSGSFYKTSNSLRMVVKTGTSVFKDLLINNSGISGPEINIIGDNPTIINKNDIYNDAGANMAGTSINLDTTINVNTTIIGNNNTVTYKANDSSGNIAKIIRYVHVV